MTGKYISNARNKQIAAIFKEAGIIEKYGSGIQRVIEAFEEYNLEIPEFSNFQHGFRVLVFAKKEIELNGGLNGGLNDLFDIIQTNPNKRTKELSELMKMPYKTLEKWLDKLKKMNKIEYRGSKKTGGYVVK